MSSQSYLPTPLITFQPLNYQLRTPKNTICVMCSMVPHGATCPSCLSVCTTWVNQPRPDATFCQLKHVKHSNVPSLTDTMSREYPFWSPELVGMTGAVEMGVQEEGEEEGESVWYLDGEMMGMIGLEASEVVGYEDDEGESAVYETSAEREAYSTIADEPEESSTYGDEDYDADDDSSTLVSSLLENYIEGFGAQGGVDEEEVEDLHDYRPFILFGEFPNLPRKTQKATGKNNLLREMREEDSRQLSYVEMVERWRREL